MEWKSKRAYTIKEFVAATGISQTAVYRLMKTGALVSQKMGGRNLILFDEAERFLKALPKRPMTHDGS